MLDPQAAWEILEPHLRPLPELAAFRRHAMGRVTARDLFATGDTPTVDVSAMDGFALPGSVEPDRRLVVAGTIAAGDPPGASVRPGETLRIFTGAPVPAGVDRVVPVEDVEESDGRILCRRLPDAGRHIRRRGEVVRQGDLLLPAGSPLEPSTLALLATHGYEHVPVHRPPRVSFLTTGNEVVPPDREPGPGQLRDSHTDFLLAALSGMALDLTPLGIAPDTASELERRIRSVLPRCDVLLLSGGVSRGLFDLVRDALSSAGCEILFHRVAIQPGKPLLAARHPEGALVFGLPGNPAAVMACFWLFVRPALRRLQGLDDRFWGGALRATLAAPLPPAKSRDRFLPASAVVVDGELLVNPGNPVGSHDLRAYGRGSALVRIPARSPGRAAGESCRILPLAEWRVG